MIVHLSHQIIFCITNHRSIFFRTIYCIILYFSIFSSEAQKQYPYGLVNKKYQIEIVDTNFIVSNKAFGGSTFIGYGMNFNNISHYFTDPILIGFTLDFYINKFLFQGEANLGFGKTIKEMLFSDGHFWGKDKFALSAHSGLKLGYSIVDNRHILLTPNLGIGTKTMTSNFLFTYNNSTYNPLLALYKIGLFMDVKSLRFMQNQIRINNQEVNYVCLRLSINYEGVIGKPKYADYFYGNMLYFTIGMGGLGRSCHRKKSIENKYI